MLIVSSVLLWIVLICNVLLTLALVRNANKPAKKKWELVSEPEGLKEGAEAPAFSAQTLDGTRVLLEDYQNQALMLVFIAPHCSACDEVLPALNKMASQMAGTKLVLACDGTLEQARVLAKKQDITLPLLVAPRQENSFFSDYLIHGTPTYYLINTQGQIQATGHMPLVATTRTAMSQLAGIVLPEFEAPLSHGFVRDDNPALCQKLFDITKTERKTKIQPDRVADNFRWEAIACVIGSRFVCFHVSSMSHLFNSLLGES